MSNTENKLTLKVLNKAKTNDIKSIFILQNGCEKDKYHKILLKDFNAKWKYLKTYGNIWWIPTSFSVNEVEQRVNELNNDIDMFVKRQNKVVRRSKKNEDIQEKDDDEDDEDNEDSNNEETIVENTIENVQKQDFKKNVPNSLVNPIEDKKNIPDSLVNPIEDKKNISDSLVNPIEDKKNVSKLLVTDKKKVSKKIVNHIENKRNVNESLIPNTESLVEKETKSDNKKNEEMILQFNKNNTEQIKKYVKKYTEELGKNIKIQVKDQMKDEIYKINKEINKINKEIQNINKEINKIKNKKVDDVQEEKKRPRLSDEILKFYRQYAVGNVKKDGKSNDNLYPTESDSDLSSDTDDSLVPRTPSPYKEKESESESEKESESESD